MLVKYFGNNLQSIGPPGRENIHIFFQLMKGDIVNRDLLIQYLYSKSPGKYPLSFTKIKSFRDLLGGPVVKNPPLPMQGTWVWSFLQGDLLHAAGQLSPYAATAEARAPWSPCLAKQGGHGNEKLVCCNKEQPHSTQLEKARVQQQRPSTLKK